MADQAASQYVSSIPFRMDSSVCSRKNPGVDLPAHRKTASGVWPPCGSQAASSASVAPFSDPKEYEYALRIWLGLARDAYGKNIRGKHKFRKKSSTSSCASAFWRFSSFRATIDTSAPLFVRRIASARPRPLEPPVT
jgi:hypothetical protein